VYRRSGLTLLEVLVALYLAVMTGAYVACILPRMADAIHLARVRQRAGTLLSAHYMGMMNDRPRENYRQSFTETLKLQRGAVTSVIRFSIVAEAQRLPLMDLYHVTVSWSEPAGPRELKLEGKRFIQQ